MEQYINKVIQGDCLEKLKDLPDESVDAIVSDPPYELGFMGKKWDNSGIAYNVDLWKECFRVLKPGGHLLAFGGTRTYHRMAVAIEDAGFEVRDMLEWIYASGFPKSLNVGKAVDKLQGNDREVIGREKGAGSTGINTETNNQTFVAKNQYEDGTHDITKGNSEWEGFGTALKPAHEPIIMARKPLSEKTIVTNILKHGTGAIDIDGCRIPMKDRQEYENKRNSFRGYDGKETNWNVKQDTDLQLKSSEQGRFPANIIVTDDALNQERKYPFTGKDNPNYKGGFYKKCEVCENLIWVCPYQAEKKRFCSNECRSNGHSKDMMHENNPKWQGGISEEYKKDKTSKEWKEKRLEVYTRDNFTCQSCGKTETKLDAHHIIPWRISFDDSVSNLISLCPSCHIQVEKQWKNVPSAEKSNSRYFDVSVWAEKYGLLQFPKASKKDRGVGNTHATVKPVHLMSWLVRLVSKEGDTVLDPFAGSGTTGVACKNLNRNYILIEKESEYIDIINKRLTPTSVKVGGKKNK